MTRLLAAYFNKRVVFFLLLCVCAVLITLEAPRRFTKASGAAAMPPLGSPPPIPHYTPDYTLQDGTVVDSNVTTFTDVGPSEAGSVENLDISTAYARAEQMTKQAAGRVFKESLTPHWFDEGKRFWYRNDTKDGTRDFVLVDPAKGTKQPAFDHEKMAAGLSKASGGSYQGNKLPFDVIEFVYGEGSKAILVTVSDKFWKCDLETYGCTPSDRGPKSLAKDKKDADALPPVDEPRDPAHNSYDPLLDDELSPEERDMQKKDPQKKGAPQKGGGKGPPGATKEAASPDGNWTAFVKERNVWLRSKDGREIQMTNNGVEGHTYSAVAWSPDSKAVVTYRSTPADNVIVYRIATSPPDQLYARLEQSVYPRAMDKMATHEMWLIRLDDLNLKPIRVNVEPINFRGIPRLRWSKDNKTFTFEKTDRGHQRFRVIEVDAASGGTRNIIDEKSDSMVNHYGDGAKNDTFYLQYLDETGELIYLSEMDGWKHLYLIDAKTGKIKNQMTKGEWVVRKINKLDTKNRQIWFQGSGKIPGQDPYLMHFYRVNFDGTGLVALTEGNGNHSIQYSPNQDYIVASYSRVDQAPIHELRRVSDGTKVCDLEAADVSALEATGWKYPEVFSAKGRDGTTDIWGIVYRPQKMDPSKKYPVIEYIYAGPHSNHVPKTFAATRALATLAEMGFIVVQIDGMGTMNRSKAFHAVCWKNLKDAGFPDRILWIKALAAKYSYVDSTRVGIYGTSAGGQNACGALLFHPEFYKVAVAACGCHDNRLDKSSWNESWMGLFGPHYEDSSNITHAKNLQGRLLLIVGELDTNVPPESTYRVVDALIKARKDFDFIAVPGAGHSSGGPHGERRKIDFFMQHLYGVTQPNHNLAPATMKKGKED